MARRFKVRYNRNWDVNRVVKKLAYGIIALLVGGTIVTVLGNTMLHTCSQFYTGLGLIGWTIGANTSKNGAGTPPFQCYALSGNCSDCINAVTGTSILGVIGLMTIASIVLEFISFS